MHEKLLIVLKNDLVGSLRSAQQMLAENDQSVPNGGVDSFQPARRFLDRFRQAVHRGLPVEFLLLDLEAV